MDRDKASFDQNFAQFRNLNDLLHRLPTLSTALTGGLWFAAGMQDKLPPEIRFALLYLADCFSLMLILVFRLRDVMQSYLYSIRTFNPGMFASVQGPDYFYDPNWHEAERLVAWRRAGVLSGQHAPLSLAALDQLAEIAPGWGRYALEAMYLTWVQEKGPATKSKDARFLRWAKSFSEHDRVHAARASNRALYLAMPAFQ